MAEITASQVKALRDKTGAGMMEAKKALVDAGGDEEKATELLRQRGAATAEKKSGRTAADGSITAYLENGQYGAIVEVNCETDFAAKSPDFQALVKDLAQHAAHSNASSIDSIQDEKLFSNASQTVRERLSFSS